MKERDVHKLIEQQESEAKQRMWERISAELDLQPAQPTKKSAPKLKPWKWAALAAALVCVITLSVVLPITLKDDGMQFCRREQYIVDDLGQTLEDYYSSHNNKMLYVDWYDIADDVMTLYAYRKTDKNDIIYFSETIVNGENGDILTVSATDNRMRVDIFEKYYGLSDEFAVTINNVRVRIQSDYEYTYAIFDYEKHTYYLEIDVGNANDKLADIIKGMFK